MCFRHESDAGGNFDITFKKSYQDEYNGSSLDWVGPYHLWLIMLATKSKFLVKDQKKSSLSMEDVG